MSTNIVRPVVSPSYIVPSGATEEVFCIELAGRFFSIQGIPLGWQKLLPSRLLACTGRDGARPDRIIRIQTSTDELLRPPSEPHDLNHTTKLTFSQDNVKIKSDWCEGWFSVLAGSPVDLKVHVESSPWFADVLENQLRVLVAYDVLQRGGVMLHCAAIVRGKQAVVLFGHSGAGKSTTSALALANGCSVISDDINILERIDGKWHVRPIPFSGTLNATSDVFHPVALHGLYRLYQAQEDRIECCTPARAVALLAGSAPFINQDAHRSAQLVDILMAMSAEIGVQDLYFTKSENFLGNVFGAINEAG